MTAAECLSCADPKLVGEYYAELRKRGVYGERAFQLLRAHKNCKRLADYDDVKYLTFLRGRARYSIHDLMSCVGEEGPFERFTALKCFAELEEVRFWIDTEGSWRTSDKNEAIILNYCERVMVLADAE